MKKLRDLDPKTRKIVIEVIVLVVLLVLTIAYFVITAQPPSDTEEASTGSATQSEFSTEFNTDVLEHIEDTSDYQPFFESELGKSNPFAF